VYCINSIVASMKLGLAFKNVVCYVLLMKW
jgi:hypothetical protein